LADRACFYVSLLYIYGPSINERRPALLNSLIGLFTTLINVYVTQGGHWSVTAAINAAVTAFITLISAILYWLYLQWIGPAWLEHRDMNPHIENR
jgi:hypothetical protein